MKENIYKPHIKYPKYARNSYNSIAKRKKIKIKRGKNRQRT